MTADILDKKGKKKDTIKLSERVFGVRWNPNAVHQVVVSYVSNMRQPLAHAKNRGEVSGTGKKPWRQKGSGHARHGSRRSPIWVGGGVTFGPRNDKNFDKKINRKLKKFALFSVLSKKFIEKKIYIIDSLAFDTAKTKEVDAFLKTLFPEKRPSILFVRASDNTILPRIARNIQKVDVAAPGSLNAYNCTLRSAIIFEKNALESLMKQAETK